MTDILIIGSGPAGLTAAVYALRAEKSVLILEKGAFGGQVTFSPKIENFPGSVSISGNEFADALVSQVIEAGGDFVAAEVTGLEKTEKGFLLRTTDIAYEARVVIIASGARHRALGLPREEELCGSGVSYCAVCDGAFYKNQKVAVVGGGNSALQETLLLSELCEKVTVIQNLPEFTGEEKLLNRCRQKDNIELIPGYTVRELLGKEQLTGVRIKAVENADEQLIDCAGLFIAIGLQPQNEAFADLAEMDAMGYIITDDSCRTKTAGLFAAGDCRQKKIRQITTACADGTVAALEALAYLRQAEEEA